MALNDLLSGVKKVTVAAAFAAGLVAGCGSECDSDNDCKYLEKDSVNEFACIDSQCNNMGIKSGDNLGGSSVSNYTCESGVRMARNLCLSLVPEDERDDLMSSKFLEECGEEYQCGASAASVNQYFECIHGYCSKGIAPNVDLCWSNYLNRPGC